MRNTKKLLQFLFILFLLFGFRFIYADGEIKLTLKNDGDVIFYGTVTLPPAGTLNVNDSDGNPHGVDAHSVLYIINQADIASSSFNISNLTYYPAFSAFYLKCITISGGNELCDDWQYRVDNDYPGVGMDSKILSGGESVILYFGGEELPAYSNITYTPASPPAPVSPPAPENVVSGSISVAPTPEVPTPAISIPLSDTEQGKIEEVKKMETNEIPKVVVKKSKKKSFEKKEIQNQAEVISAITDISVEEPVPQPIKRTSWFKRFFGRIFGF